MRSFNLPGLLIAKIPVTARSQHIPMRWRGGIGMPPLQTFGNKKQHGCTQRISERLTGSAALWAALPVLMRFRASGDGNRQCAPDVSWCPSGYQPARSGPSGGKAGLASQGELQWTPIFNCLPWSCL